MMGARVGRVIAAERGSPNAALFLWVTRTGTQMIVCSFACGGMRRQYGASDRCGDSRGACGQGSASPREDVRICILESTVRWPREPLTQKVEPLSQTQSDTPRSSSCRHESTMHHIETSLQHAGPSSSVLDRRLRSRLGRKPPAPCTGACPCARLACASIRPSPGSIRKNGRRPGRRPVDPDGTARHSRMSDPLARPRGDAEADKRGGTAAARARAVVLAREEP